MFNDYDLLAKRQADLTAKSSSWKGGAKNFEKWVEYLTNLVLEKN